jgi:hypothetical protein
MFCFVLLLLCVHIITYGSTFVCLRSVLCARCCLCPWIVQSWWKTFIACLLLWNITTKWNKYVTNRCLNKQTKPIVWHFLFTFQVSFGARLTCRDSCPLSFVVILSVLYVHHRYTSIMMKDIYSLSPIVKYNDKVEQICLTSKFQLKNRKYWSKVKIGTTY